LSDTSLSDDLHDQSASSAALVEIHEPDVRHGFVLRATRTVSAGVTVIGMSRAAP
jgi:hypothetical protein